MGTLLHLHMSARLTMCSLLGVAVLSTIRFWLDLGAQRRAWTGLWPSGDKPVVLDQSSSAIYHNNSRFNRVVSLEREVREARDGKPRLVQLEMVPITYNPNDKARFYPLADSSDLPEPGTKIEKRKWPEHECMEDCKPMSDWQYLSFPNCNSAHEVSFAHRVAENLNFLSPKGYWRDVWVYNETSVDGKSFLSVWKTLKTYHEMEEAYFENNRVDALVMERLTSSPYVMDVYGYCGVSIMTGYAESDIARVAGRLNSIERLHLGLKVAKGLAHLHNLGGGNSTEIVHNDLNLANVVVTEGNRPVLNDFNVAVLMMVHNTTGKPCPFSSRYPNSQWKAPEEQVLTKFDKENPPMVSEKIDIYALGNIFYRLVAGGSPWKAKHAVRLTPEQQVAVARAKRVEGKQPPIEDDIRNSKDPAVQIMLQAMDMCYRHNPTDRPSAKQIVHFVHHSAKGLNKNETNSRQ